MVVKQKEHTLQYFLNPLITIARTEDGIIQDLNIYP